MSMNKAGLEVKAGIAVLKFDHPPVNSLGLELRQAIVEGIERTNADPAVEAIILMGAGAGFREARIYANSAPQRHRLSRTS
jgi:3-hydroxyacyl-CoA dehydrogenase